LANLGLSQADIAKELDINKSTVCRAFNSAKEKGSITLKPRSTPGRKPAGKRVDVDG
jgi:transposase